MSERHPLVVIEDDTVREEILRLAAAVGCETNCVADPSTAVSLWNTAPLVLVDEAMAKRCGSSATVGGRRRDRVKLVCLGDPADHAWRVAFAVGADGVIALPEHETALVAAFADIVEQPSGQHGSVLAVIGSRGGAGTSVLSASTAAIASRRGRNALLIDCDPLGGGVDLLLGAEASQGVRWPEMAVSSGRIAMTELDAALPRRQFGDGSLSFLSCDRDGHGPAASAVNSVVEAGRRAGRVVVCDLPRQPDPCADEVLRCADLVVVVVPAEVRACVAATRILTRLGDRCDRVRLLVRGPAPDGLTAQDVTTAVGAPLLTWVRPERRLAQALERGAFRPAMRGALGKAAGSVLDELVNRRLNER